MVRRGLFRRGGALPGGYRHDLREEGLHRARMRHYRFRNYLYRNCEKLPHPRAGPIANVLDINHGNRMLTLVQWRQGRGLHEYLLRNEPGLRLLQT